MSFEVLRKIRKEVERGAVTERAIGSLSIFKYSQECVCDNMWNDDVVRCRGIVFDTDTGTIVCRPYDKFFNLNERPSTELKEVVNKLKTQSYMITEKLDGSCLSIWNYKGKWCASTPGSISSEQAVYAMEQLFPKYNLDALPTDLTYVCEMIAPWNRMVVDYGDRNELVMVTAFENKWQCTEIAQGRVKMLADKAGLNFVEEIPCDDLESFLMKPVPEGEEGYVIRFSDGSRIKLKGAWYFKLHKLASLLSLKNVFEMVSEQPGAYDEVIEDVPDYIRKDFDDIYAQIMTTRDQVQHDVQQIWNSVPDHTDFKACALVFKEHDTSPVLFAKMRGREDVLEQVTWKVVKNRLEI